MSGSAKSKSALDVLTGPLGRVIGEQLVRIVPEIVEAIKGGHEWEPLIDKLGRQTKVAIAQELAKDDLVRDVEEIRRRYLDELP